MLVGAPFGYSDPLFVVIVFVVGTIRVFRFTVSKVSKGDLVYKGFVTRSDKQGRGAGRHLGGVQTGRIEAIFRLSRG